MIKAKQSLPLSPRLSAIFNELIPSYSVWDLCCDHGLLGLACYQSQKFPEVNFVDKVEEIILNLSNRFQKEITDSNNKTSVRFIPSDAQMIKQKIEGNLVLAGVGARTISEILTTLKIKEFLKVQRIVLCPQNYESKLIEFMKSELSQDYGSVSHSLIKEKSRNRSILVYDRKEN